MTNEVRLYELRYDEAKTYVNVLLFVAGNILLPRMFHLFHMGGPTWQPIFFFTLVGAYKYGWRVGLLTALFSPLLNYAFFGMPSSVMLPVVMAKSVLLAATAALVARHRAGFTLLSFAFAVLVSQVLGTLLACMFFVEAPVALRVFCTGIPGMLLQILGGYTLIRAFNKR